VPEATIQNRAVKVRATEAASWNRGTMENKTPILEVKHLCKYFYHGKTPMKAVDDVNFQVFKGETFGLVGESGCGKSTLGQMLVHLLEPTSGEILLEGEDVTRPSKKRFRELCRRTQIVFQDPYSSLNPSFTIFQSLADPLRHFGVKDKEEQRKIIGDILEAVNMRREYMDRYPHEFSGGQRQRIGIARALCVNPEMVVCDEAVSALDVSIQAQVLNLLMKLKEERNLTYIFITHNLSVVEYISDRIAVMYLGKIDELADTEQIFDNTMHPYTEALLSAIPIVDPDHKHSRIVLEGDVPNPVRPPDGCLFHPRCKKCMEICKKERPKLIKHTVEGKDHFCACHLYDNGVAQKG